MMLVGTREMCCVVEKFSSAFCLIVCVWRVYVVSMWGVLCGDAVWFNDMWRVECTGIWFHSCFRCERFSV